jgi:predicted DNA-binding mobile mystery protein A
MTKSRARLDIMALTRRQLDTQLESWRHLPDLPREGWIRALRAALGMPAFALARKLSVSPSVITRLERSEKDGTITLNSLRKIADAIGGEVVYAIVPRKSLDDILVDRANHEANRRYRRVSHTMALEDQRVTDEETRAQKRELAARLIATADKLLWDDFGSR